MADAVGGSGTHSPCVRRARGTTAQTGTHIPRVRRGYGSYFFTVVASDNHGNRVEKEFSLEVKEPPAPVEQTAASTAAVARQGNERDYVLNKNTHKFHYPSCGGANRIADHNRWGVHMTREQIASTGYSSCAHCNP